MTFDHRLDLLDMAIQQHADALALRLLSQDRGDRELAEVSSRLMQRAERMATLLRQPGEPA